MMKTAAMAMLAVISLAGCTAFGPGVATLPDPTAPAAEDADTVNSVPSGQPIGVITAPTTDVVGVTHAVP